MKFELTCRRSNLIIRKMDQPKVAVQGDGAVVLDMLYPDVFQHIGIVKVNQERIRKFLI